MTEEQSNVPAQPGEIETMGVRQGMFGVEGSGDTSGYGGLVKPTIFPGASQRPYGGWYDEVADAL
jgi:NADH-quinone oxidoreductase subunit C